MCEHRNEAALCVYDAPKKRGPPPKNRAALSAPTAVPAHASSRSTAAVPSTRGVAPNKRARASSSGAALRSSGGEEEDGQDDRTEAGASDRPASVVRRAFPRAAPFSSFSSSSSVLPVLLPLGRLPSASLSPSLAGFAEGGAGAGGRHGGGGGPHPLRATSFGDGTAVSASHGGGGGDAYSGLWRGAPAGSVALPPRDDMDDDNVGQPRPFELMNQTVSSGVGGGRGALTVSGHEAATVVSVRRGQAPHLSVPDGPTEPSPVGAQLYASIFNPSLALVVPTQEERGYLKSYFLFQARVFLPLVDEASFVADLSVMVKAVQDAEADEVTRSSYAVLRPDFAVAHKMAAGRTADALGTDRLLALRALFHAVVAFGAAVSGRKGRAQEYYHAARVYSLPSVRRPSAHTISLLYILAFMMASHEAGGAAAGGSATREADVMRATAGHLASSPGLVPDIPPNLRLTAMLMEYGRVQQEYYSRLRGTAHAATPSLPSAPMLVMHGATGPLTFPIRAPGPPVPGEDKVHRLGKIYIYTIQQQRSDFDEITNAAEAAAYDSLLSEAGSIADDMDLWRPIATSCIRFTTRIYLAAKLGRAGPVIGETEVEMGRVMLSSASMCEHAKSRFPMFLVSARLFNTLLHRLEDKYGADLSKVTAVGALPWTPAGYAALPPTDLLRLLPYVGHYLTEACNSGLCPLPPDVAAMRQLKKAGLSEGAEQPGGGGGGGASAVPVEAQELCPDATADHVAALCMLSSDPSSSKGSAGAVPSSCPVHAGAMVIIQRAVRDAKLLGVGIVGLPPPRDISTLRMGATDSLLMSMAPCIANAQGGPTEEMGDEEGDRDSVAVGDEGGRYASSVVMPLSLVSGRAGAGRGGASGEASYGRVLSQDGRSGQRHGESTLGSAPVGSSSSSGASPAAQGGLSSFSMMDVKGGGERGGVGRSAGSAAAGHATYALGQPPISMSVFSAGFGLRSPRPTAWGPLGDGDVPDSDYDASSLNFMDTGFMAVPMPDM